LRNSPPFSDKRRQRIKISVSDAECRYKLCYAVVLYMNYSDLILIAQIWPKVG
jgi:hypothetical protein